MQASTSTFVELESDPGAKTAQLADSALDAIDAGKEVSVISKNTYVIKKEEPKVTIGVPTLRTTYEESDELYDAP
jgi:hypothetical protein